VLTQHRKDGDSWHQLSLGILIETEVLPISEDFLDGTRPRPVEPGCGGQVGRVEIGIHL
jgi:hypothetical protein